MKFKKILFALLAVLLIIQFFRIDKTNPVAEPESDFIAISEAPDEIAIMMKNACYDCHSYHSKYPWYSNVAPVSWVVKKHIDEGREHVNFSVWDSYASNEMNHKLEECIEVLQEAQMPPGFYTPFHEEAKLTVEDRKKLIAWFEKQK
jgi:hypothetical protein